MAVRAVRCGNSARGSCPNSWDLLQRDPDHVVIEQERPRWFTSPDRWTGTPRNLQPDNFGGRRWPLWVIIAALTARRSLPVFAYEQTLGSTGRYVSKVPTSDIASLTWGRQLQRTIDRDARLCAL